MPVESDGPTTEKWPATDQEPKRLKGDEVWSEVGFFVMKYAKPPSEKHQQYGKESPHRRPK